MISMQIVFNYITQKMLYNPLNSQVRRCHLHTKSTMPDKKHIIRYILSQGPFLKTYLMKYSRSCKLTKTFITQAVLYSLLRCNGLNCGMTNKTKYRTACKCPAHHLLIIPLSHVPAPMLTSTYGTWENIKTKTLLSIKQVKILIFQTAVKPYEPWSILSPHSIFYDVPQHLHQLQP